MSCRVERLTLLREYRRVAGGLYLDGNRVKKVIGHGRTDRAPARLRIRTISRFHVSVDRDLTHKAGLWLLVVRPVW
jgi:hypothetical protein